MQISKVKIKRLLSEYSTGTIKPFERDELLEYLQRASNDPELDSLLDELFEEMDVDPDLIIPSDLIYHNVINHPTFNDEGKMSKRKNVWWLAGAAAAIALIVFRMFLFPGNTVDSGQQPVVPLAKQSPSKIVPSEKKAILRLADGTEIDLDEAENGLIAIENNMQISLKGTTLHYEHDPVFGQDDATAMNTISTTTGRQFQVVLPDGTKMWLNALSRLTYPVRFDSKVREVEITGEAYFEVEKASDWPFIVKTTTQEVKVLGTHFNISAYDDDDVFKTTLVEGSLKVTAIGKNTFSNPSTPSPIEKSVLLQPGQQAITYKGNDGLSMEKVDSEEVISWKQNLFVFNNEEVEEGMKKVMRWYGIEIVYLDGMEGKRIGGTIPRFGKIEQLMDALETTGVFHYKMEGGKVVIMK